MTRRKSVCINWTLVLIIVLVSPYVYARPQETPAETTSNGREDIPIRYTYRNVSLNSFKTLPIVITFVHNTKNAKNVTAFDLNSIYLSKSDVKEAGVQNTSARLSRLIHSSTRKIKKKNRPNRIADRKPVDLLSPEHTKSTIRKIITKWRDETKYDDLNYSFENIPALVKNKTKFDDASTDESNGSQSSDEINSKRYDRPYNDMYYNMYDKPRPDYSDESHVYSTNIQVVDTNSYPHVINHYPRPTRPSYFHTNAPTPTPIVTNLGYPKPWTQNIRRTTTTERPKPTKYVYHNNIDHHGGNYEVTTFEPSSSYTDRIVIRPQEYSPSSEDCPTIFLTLNNTFQGEGKEACPDLNIAVNTNVVNKNVVVESEEESDSLFPGFNLGLGDDSVLNLGDESGSDSSKGEDYSEEENAEQNDSASVEGTELANYHSANSPIQSQSSEAGGFGASSSPLAALTKPGHSGGDEDDIFSSVAEFFRPALSALNWLATISPLSMGLFPFLLAPLGLIFAGTGLAALFSPWFLPIGREAPKVVHVYRPEWQWDNNLKTWELNSFPTNRNVMPEIGRANAKREENQTTPTIFVKLKQWMANFANVIKQKSNQYLKLNERESKRKKRGIWFPGRKEKDVFLKSTVIK